MLSDAKSGDIFDLFGGNLLATVLSQLINMLGFFFPAFAPNLVFAMLWGLQPTQLQLTAVC